MCGENDNNGAAAGSSRRLPAVGAMRGPCIEEKLKTVVVVLSDDDDDYEEEFRRYCENTTLPAKGDKGGRRRPAASKKQHRHRFHGIHRRKSGRWSAEIRDNMIKGSRSWVGTFDTAEEAAWAYDAVARRLYGPNARTNFPLPPPPPPPVAPLLPAPAVANKKMNSKSKKPAPKMVVAPAGGETAAAAGEMAPVLLGNALEATNGWEFEPYSCMGLVVCSAVYNYADEPEPADDELQLLHLMHGGAMADFAADGCLWSF
uniref:Ethylene response factor n=1 Tax=Oryza sativa subsp. indica TaxID=39946 RepID=C6L7X5_ORYSI|nr:ethylene response factor [Oryza sativa Indica Group]BAH96567.1 ethylene response factor [Oryza sativa Indica Group]BDE46687.1 transcriptional factor [Oryza sativa Indica Group]BDE46700.1 transcriptional factor [Oryza sativa Indica Group x Oryza sativa Japonica Group]